MSTTSTITQEDVRQIHIVREVTIAAPIEIAFAAIIAEMSNENLMPDDQPFPMQLETWPGGRWFRDLGNNTGHLWAHVQVIKPPKLLELCGPMFMSYPASNHLQYRLSAGEDGNSTRLKFTHRAIGLIPADHAEGVSEGWEHGLKRINQIATRMRKEGK